MSNLYICHYSALLFYREQRNNRYRNLSLKISKSKVNYRNSKCANKLPQNMIKNHIYENLDEPFDVLLNDASLRTRSKNLNFHVFTNTLPNYAFYKLHKGVYIATPELLFYQLATCIPYEQLLIIGLEMCGTYTLTAKSELVSNVAPITTAKRIQSFLKNFQNKQYCYKGLKLACEVSAILTNNSASPQESRLYALLASRRHRGGLGLLDIELNPEIQLSSKASRTLGQSYIKPDLALRSQKLVVEYDSTAYHENENQDSRDKMRMNAYKIDG